MAGETEAALKRARCLLGRLADAFENAVVLMDDEVALVKAARAEAAKTIPEPAGESGETTNTQTETTKP